jgi:hypothetical protein
MAATWLWVAAMLIPSPKAGRSDDEAPCRLTPLIMARPAR